MKNTILYTTAVIFIMAMLAVIISASKEMYESDIKYFKETSEYTVIIDSVYSANPEYKITQQDIDDAILEIMEDAMYNEN